MKVQKKMINKYKLKSIKGYNSMTLGDFLPKNPLYV
jgi:hypothetical protein